MQRNILITLTGPSASGKNFLLEKLLERKEFIRVVGCTSRAPRAYERPGVDYNFLTDKDFIDLLSEDKLAEHVVFQGINYGILKSELEDKITKGIPIVIVEPSGIQQYEKYCQQNGIILKSVFVKSDPELRTSRLFTRLLHEFDKPKIDSVKDLLQRYEKRLISCWTEEENWDSIRHYDLIVSGEGTNEILKICSMCKI